ncbi:lipopolysaccharide biosynthesis protein [Phenylobacterium sp.]|uniref:lipopolysaccharide biosynthesis protein n=1 Tax=Phenylobacterium sp. TaxID=1871053 RepID=UPI002F423BF7
MDDPITQEIEASQLKRISVRGGAITAVSQGAKFVIRMAAQITIARLLLPSDYGLVAMIAPVLSLVVLLADLGIGQAVVQHPDITRRQMSALFWLGSAINIGVALSVIVCAPLIALAYHEPRLIRVAMVAAVMVPLGGLATQHFALLTRNVRFQALAILDVLAPLCSLAVGLAAAYAGWSYWSLLASQAAESIVMVIGAWLATGWIPGPPRREPGLRSILKVGGHITGTNLATYVTSTADNIILGVFGGDQVLGLYDKGYRTVTQPLGQLLMPFNRVATPTLLRRRDDAARYRKAYLNMLELVLLLVWPGAVCGAVIATPLFEFLLGSHWTGIGPIASWLCFGVLASPLYSSTYWLFTSQSRTGTQMKYGVGLAVISLVGFIAGLPWGAAGVAAGAGLSFTLLGTPLVLLGATREGPVRRMDLGLTLVPFCVAAAVVFAVIFTAYDRFKPHGLELFAMVPVSYLLFAAILGGFPRGREMLRGVLRLREQFKPSNPTRAATPP